MISEIEIKKNKENFVLLLVVERADRTAMPKSSLLVDMLSSRQINIQTTL